VPAENYAASFGLEWNIHERTQYDSTSLHDQSRRRLFEETKWPESLVGETILEVGSGSGRFTEVALTTGATVVSFDYSNSVEANYRSNGGHENLLLVQANVYEMPFPKEFFDRIYCFGMLQHTPDPKTAFLALSEYLKQGGYLASDIYRKSFAKCVLGTQYWVRPVTKRMDPERLYDFVVSYVKFMWPLARLIRRIPKFGVSLNWRLLIADYSRNIPNADDRILKEWAYLNTFDMLAPAHDHPQTVSTFRSWHDEAGLVDVEVHPGYNGIEGRGRKPN
jgi:ubiquinone/menaquinone biosynthesis C-methylase UbiE